MLKVELILDTRGFSGGLLESSRIDPGEFGFSSAEKFLYRMDLEFFGNLPQMASRKHPALPHFLAAGFMDLRRYLVTMPD